MFAYLAHPKFRNSLFKRRLFALDISFVPYYIGGLLETALFAAIFILEVIHRIAGDTLISGQVYTDIQSILTKLMFIAIFYSLFSTVLVISLFTTTTLWSARALTDTLKRRPDVLPLLGVSLWEFVSAILFSVLATILAIVVFMIDLDGFGMLIFFFIVFVFNAVFFGITGLKAMVDDDKDRLEVKNVPEIVFISLVAFVVATFNFAFAAGSAVLNLAELQDELMGQDSRYVFTFTIQIFVMVGGSVMSIGHIVFILYQNRYRYVKSAPPTGTQSPAVIHVDDTPDSLNDDEDGEGPGAPMVAISP